MSHLRTIIEDRLGYSLKQRLETAKSEGTSCRKIAESLTNETGIKVSKSVVHNWLQNT